MLDIQSVTEAVLISGAEGVKVITEWALSQDGVKQVEVEIDAENIASQKVLFRTGFIRNGKLGEEGPRFVYGGKVSNAACLFVFDMILLVCVLKHLKRGGIFAKRQQ